MKKGGPVNEGETGEIVARGSRMMTGYWQEESATQDAMRDGWIYTGDLGYQDLTATSSCLEEPKTS
ncbi:MAG: hypothetical protein Ct9H300mP11_30290 [Chloroflexota bacterium]|nr:MAG: hypothetical protein Ct9H300mP11_30290 [Chloroflexota bacterium]